MIYKGYNIHFITNQDGLVTPQIWLNDVWIHEWGAWYENKEVAINQAKKFIDTCNGIPTTDEELFNMFKRKH